MVWPVVLWFCAVVYSPQLLVLIMGSGIFSLVIGKKVLASGISVLATGIMAQECYRSFWALMQS